MSNPLFTPQFKGSLNEEAIHEIVEQLKSEGVLRVKDVNFGAYFKGLRAFRNCENGLYFFRFQNDSYYIGLASSCTFMERLSKHVDGRYYGGFNSLLRKLGNEPEETSYFEKGQEVFSNATVLFMPLFIDELPLKGVQELARKEIDDFLEKDVIYLFKHLRYSIGNVRIPKKLSNYFDYGK
jgi:hypothetical protein